MKLWPIQNENYHKFGNFPYVIINLNNKEINETNITGVGMNESQVTYLWKVRCNKNLINNNILTISSDIFWHFYERKFWNDKISKLLYSDKFLCL